VKGTGAALISSGTAAKPCSHTLIRSKSRQTHTWTDAKGVRTPGDLWRDAENVQGAAMLVVFVGAIRIVSGHFANWST